MKKRRLKQKQIKYCACCGKIVNGHDVVRSDHAKVFLEKQGFSVGYDAWPWAPDKKIKTTLIKTFTIFMMFLFVFPFVSSATFVGGLQMDLTQNYNVVFLAGALLLSILLFFFRFYVYSALILLVGGFLMMMNGVNFLVALIPMVASWIIVTKGGGK